MQIYKINFEKSAQKREKQYRMKKLQRDDTDLFCGFLLFPGACGTVLEIT